MYENKKALLLDMNGTFMFGQDRFGLGENYSKYYHSIGGKLSADAINGLITKIYNYLESRYN